MSEYDDNRLKPERMYEYENNLSAFHDKYSCESDWLEELSPSILEAFNEYTTDKEYKEDY